jgi:DnaJ homolog subfamily A member 2
VEGVKRGGAGEPQFDPELSDWLNHMFGGGIPTGNGRGDGGGGWGRRTRDAVKEFDVSLEDLYKGKQVKMMSKRKVVCSSCKG